MFVLYLYLYFVFCSFYFLEQGRNFVSEHTKMERCYRCDDVAVCGLNVAMFICDDDGNDRMCTMWKAPGFGPFADKQLTYVGIPSDSIGTPFYLRVWYENLALAPIKIPDDKGGHVYTGNPLALHVHVNEKCAGSTTILHFDNPEVFIEGKYNGANLRRFVLEAPVFADSAKALELETAFAQTKIQIRVNMYAARDEGISVTTSIPKSPLPTSTVLPDMPKARAIKVMAGLEAASASESTPVKTERINIQFLKEIGSLDLYLAPLSELEARAAGKRLKR